MIHSYTKIDSNKAKRRSVTQFFDEMEDKNDLSISSNFEASICICAYAEDALSVFSGCWLAKGKWVDDSRQMDTLDETRTSADFGCLEKAKRQ